MECGGGGEEEEAPFDDLMLDTMTQQGDEGDAELVADDGDVMFADHDGAGDKRVRNRKDHVASAAEDGEDGLKEQLAMVQAMVGEMKAGFLAALEQLQGLQDSGEAGGRQQAEVSTRRHGQQVADLSQALDGLKREVGTLSSSVRQVVDVQQGLRVRLEALQSGQQQLLQELFSAGVLSQAAREAVAKWYEGSASSHQAQQIHGAVVSSTTKQTESESDVTRTACKSLSLTQALAAQCQDLDVSDSTEDDVHAAPEDQQDHVLPRTTAALESSQRRQAVQEITDCDQEYCSQLMTLLRIFQAPLQDSRIISSRQLHLLFPGSLPELCQQHSQLLHSLQDRLLHWSYAGVVGDVFARMTDSSSIFLGLYEEYVQSLPGSISCLRHQTAFSRPFRHFLKAQREAHPTADLMSLLLVPLHKIPKYMLQLQQVLRHTGESHPDYHNLQASLSKLQDFVEKFNHCITHSTQAIALGHDYVPSRGQGSSFSTANGSSVDVMPATTSTVNSSIQNITDDSFSASDLHSGHTDHNGYLPQWLDHSSRFQQSPTLGSVGCRPSGLQYSTPQRITSNSQPDLTAGSGPPRTIADTQRAISRLVAAAAPDETSGTGPRRYRIKKRPDGVRSARSPVRPTSAVDFADNGAEREQVLPRPHSVMGPVGGDNRSRVLQVVSRKPPPNGQRTAPSSVPSHFMVRPSPQPKVHAMLNGQWEGSGASMDRHHPLSRQGGREEEDDTLVSSSPRSSSHHSQDAGQTDNSDLSQEELTAAMSHHLSNSSMAGRTARPEPLSAHDLSKLYPSHHRYHDRHQAHVGQILHAAYNESEVVRGNVNNNDSHGVDDGPSAGGEVSRDSDSLQSANGPSKVFDHTAQDRHADVRGFHDSSEDRKPQVHKRTEQWTKDRNSSDAHVNLPAQPSPGLREAALNTAQIAYNTASVREMAIAYNTASVRDMAKSMTENSHATSLPPKHRADSLPNGQNGHGSDIDSRASLSGSVTPNRFSTALQSSYRRAVTPSAELFVDGSASKGSRRGRRDQKTSSSENLRSSSDDVTLSASKKRPFRTSLKNLFQRKKGSIILDELEKEYTRELVRRCLQKNGDSNTGDSVNHTATSNRSIVTTCSINDTNGHNVDAVLNDIDNSHSSVDLNKTKNGFNTALSLNNNHSSPAAGFWAKMRKSPLFFIYRNGEGEAGEVTV